jgi:Amt family ammonium transporter
VTPAAALCLVFILLVPLAGAGLSLMNTGLGRSRNAAHAMLASLCLMAVAALVYCVCGFAWQGLPGRPTHVFMVGGKPWSLIGAEPLWLGGIDFDAVPVLLALFLEILSVGLAALIPLGSAGERWRLGAACASTALLAGLVYPLFAHWVWGGGWLAQLGSNYGIGRGFTDAGGAAVTQTLGGLTALSVTWILGPRKGKYALNGMPAAIPGHNAVVVLVGCFFTLLGWFGLNSASAMLFNGVAPARMVLIGINTTLSAASAVLATAAITGFRFGKPDASLCANGWVSGLVASSAACAFVTPLAAAVTGMFAGALVTFTIAWFEWPLSIDDPCGSVSVHAVAGIWGLLTVGMFARFPNAASGQWLAQLIGIATLLGLILPLTYTLNWLLNRFYPQRVTAEGERQGLDLHELGAGAYPEFVTHNEEFTQQ